MAIITSLWCCMLFSDRVVSLAPVAWRRCCCERRNWLSGWNATRTATSSVQHFLPWTLAAAAAASFSRSHWPAAAPRFPSRQLMVIPRPPSRLPGHSMWPPIYQGGRSCDPAVSRNDGLEPLRATPAKTRLLLNGQPLLVGHTVCPYQRRLVFGYKTT